MTASGARGIRNNNPGNLRRSDDQWDGLAPQQSDPEFFQFDSPEAGIRAMTRVLSNYQSQHGLRSVADMIGRYAPPSENRTNDYARFVSTELGVDPHAPVDLANEETAARLVDAMIRMENGANPYTPETIRIGVRAGLGMGDLQQALSNVDRVSIRLHGAAPERPPVTGPNFDMHPAPYKGRVSFNDISVPAPYTTAMEEAAQRKAEELTPSLWEGAKMAAQAEWGVAWSLMEKPDFVRDPGFKIDPKSDLWKEVTAGIPTKHLDVFEDAVSEGHFRFLGERVRRELELDEQLARMGWTGVGLRLGAAVLDPVSIGAAVATEGLAAPIIAATKVGRVSKAALAGTTAALSTLPPTILLADEKLTSDWTDVAHTAFGAFALGSAIRAARGGADVAEQEALAAIAAKGRAGIENALVPDNPTDARIVQLRRDLGMQRGQADQAPVKPVEMAPHGPLTDSVGAARATSYQEVLSGSAEQRRIDAVGSPETAFGSVRYDAVGQVKSSKHDIVRQVGGQLAEDAVGNADHSVNVFGASERQALMQREFETRFHRSAEPAFREWAAERGLGWLDRQRQRSVFMEEVTQAIRDDLAKVSPQARKFASEMQDMYEELRLLAQNPGRREGIISKAVRGFDNVAPNRNYITRIYDARKVRELVAEFGDQNVAELFARSMAANAPGLDIDLARKYSAWHLKKVRGHAVESDISTMRALAGEDYDTLREILKVESDMDPDSIERLIAHLQKPGDGAHTRAKHRLSLDENFSIKLTNIHGTEVRDVAIKDLLVNDAEQLFNLYLRQMSGAVALARTGFSSRGEIDTLLKHIRATAPDIPGYTEAALASDIANLEFLFTMVGGSPVGSFGQRLFADRSSKVGQMARLVRDFNFTRLMGQVGFAQLAEVGNVMGTLGIRTALEAVPGFKTLWRNAKTGKLDDDLMDEMEAMFGLGTDRLRGVVMNRWDDFGSAIHPTEGKVMTRIDTALQHGKRVVADVSGLAGVNIALHRWTAKGIAHRFASMAHGGKQFSDERLASLGLSRDMVDRIGAQIREHSDTADGVLTGRKMLQINLDRWSDQTAAENFRLGVWRLARRIIQENDPGNMHRWMTTTSGQLIFQFRHFMGVAYAKQFLAGLHQRDWETWSSWMLSMFAGAGAYIVQTHAQSIGRADREQFLEKQLSPESIGKAGFQRAGFTSLLPLATDLVAGAFTSDPIFDYRTTGLSTSVFGNPTFDLMDKGKSAVQGVGRVLVDPNYQWSQENLRNVWGLLPFQNVLGIKNVQSVLSGQLPRRSSTD